MYTVFFRKKNPTHYNNYWNKNILLKNSALCDYFYKECNEGIWRMLVTILEKIWEKKS